MKKILITGANGQLGQEFTFLSESCSDFEFVFLTKDQLDICDEDFLLTYFSSNKFDYCFNCAAYTAVDKAENEIALAEKVNITGVVNLAEICAEQSIPMIHFSTDYVYNALQNTPYKETDPTNPQGIYAVTKLEGEKQLLNIHSNAMVIRTSWVYSGFGQNFVKTMLRLGKERDELRVVCDQIGTPTYARDLATAVLQILEQIERDNLKSKMLSGIYNYSNEGVCSWYDFALAIFEITGINCRILPVESKDYPTPAKRPPFSVLNKTKFKSAFDMEIPHWRESLKEMIFCYREH